MTKLSHLKDINVPNKNTKEVMLLTGTNSPAAHKPLEVSYDNNDQPYAVRTRFGLAVRGPVGTINVSNKISLSFLSGEGHHFQICI